MQLPPAPRVAGPLFVIPPRPLIPGERAPFTINPGAVMLVLPASVPLAAIVIVFEVLIVAAFASRAGSLIAFAPILSVETPASWPGVGLPDCRSMVPLLRLIVETPPPP